MAARPPVITILGHVDHGKTTLLDTLRKSRIAAREHGGITQRIGAYELPTNIKGYSTDKITFIDTPGHEAFTMLRSRGANVADIAILVIDAKDSLRPQTVESISHIKNAKIPYIVALNKIDLPEANPNKVKNDLLKHEVMTEDKGGTIPVVEISAKTGKGVPELLESLLLMAADLNLSFDPAKPALAYIIETKKDKRGAVASAVIKEGTLKVGDTVYADKQKCKIRALINDLGESVREVQPSTPFEIIGFEQIPDVGTIIQTTEPEAKAEVAGPSTVKKIGDVASFLVAPVQEKKLAAIIKTDSQGSLDAIQYSLSKNDGIDIILAGVGDVHRSDVFLAKTTKAIIIGFSVKSDNEVVELAKQEKVIIKTYNIIYELLDELTEVSRLIQEKEEKEKNLKGEAKVVATFMIEGEKIFGVKVTKGKMNLGDSIDVYRDDKKFSKTKLISLKHRAKSINEVKKDMDAGMIFSPALDLRVGDVVKSVL